MLEESVSLLPSLWASINSWFTPTVLFVLLNLMIGTIAISSTFASSKHHEPLNPHLSQDADPHPYQLSRYPSMLQRFRSISLYSYRDPEPVTSFHEESAPDADLVQQHYAYQEQRHPYLEEKQPQNLTRSPSLLERLKSINFYSYRAAEPVTTSFHVPHQPAQTHHHQQYPALEQHIPQEERPRNLTRAPSILERLKSINFSQYLFPEPSSTLQHSVASSHKHHAADTHHDSSPGCDDSGYSQYQEPDQSMDEIYSRLKAGHVNRCNSDTKPAAGEVPPKLSSKMKKSASTKSAFSHFREKDIVENRRPATARKEKVCSVKEVDEEVDAKADDFINRFKQQLKLQRLDSIMRYKNMISRVAGN